MKSNLLLGTKKMANEFYSRIDKNKMILISKKRKKGPFPSLSSGTKIQINKSEMDAGPNFY